MRGASGEIDPQGAGRAAEALLDVVPSGCFVLDCEGVIRGVNGDGARLLGGRPECVAGRLLADFVTAGSREALIEHLVSVQTGAQATGCDVELRLGASRTRRWLRLRSGIVPGARSLTENVLCIAVEIDDLRSPDGSASDPEGVEAEACWDPAYGAIPGEGEEQHRQAAPNHDRGSERQRLLVVDDDELFLSSTVRVLRGVGYGPAGFKSAEEALEAFSAEPHAYLAVVTDYRMPGMDGLELASRIRALRADVPIVMISGCATPVEQADLDAAGVWQVLAKPINVEKLVGSLEELTGREVAQPPS